MTANIPNNVIYPTGGGAVNIQIFNPSVNNGQSMPCAYPIPAPQLQPQFAPNNITNNTNNTVNNGAPQGQPLATSPISGNKDEKKTKKKEIVQLTDDYIKTLENYLRNQSTDVRVMGVKELLARFKEDKSRKNDKALTSLLNLALQDSSQSARVLALAALDSGYATGNELTAELLKKLQKTDNVYNQDALLASQVLLKMAGKKINVVSDEIDEKPVKKAGNKLDIYST